MSYTPEVAYSVLTNEDQLKVDGQLALRWWQSHSHIARYDNAVVTLLPIMQGASGKILRQALTICQGVKTSERDIKWGTHLLYSLFDQWH